MVWEVLMIFALATLLALLLVGGLGWRREEDEALWSAVVFIVFILFPALWIADLWLRPAGPQFIGVYWLPLLVAGFIVLLILAATRPPRPRTRVRKKVDSEPAPAATQTAFGFFFWLLVVLLIAAIIAGYNLA